MKPSLPILALGATLLIPALAQAQQLPPALNPGLAGAAAQQQLAQQSNVLYWYNLLPPQIFSAFGNADRVQLLRQQDSIFDQEGGFIEVPVPGDADENDVEKLQVKLYQGQKGMMVAVSQVVWNQPRVKGALAFFAMGNGDRLLDVTRQVFAYDLNAMTADQMRATTATAPADPMNEERPDGETNQNAAPPVNAILAHNGTTIITGIPETDTRLSDYVWENSLFIKREAPNEDAPTR